MKNPILRRINVSGIWQPLAATRTVGSFTIRANSSASTSLAMRSDDGLAEVPLEPFREGKLHLAVGRTIAAAVATDHDAEVAGRIVEAEHPLPRIVELADPRLGRDPAG